MFMGTPGNVAHLIEFSPDGAPRRRGTHPPISRLPPRASTHPARPAARRTDTRWPGDPCRPPTHPPSAPIGPFHPSNGPARRAHGPRFGPCWACYASIAVRLGCDPPPPAPIRPLPARLPAPSPPVRGELGGSGSAPDDRAAVRRQAGWVDPAPGWVPGPARPASRWPSGGVRTRFEAPRSGQTAGRECRVGSLPLDLLFSFANFR